MKHQGKKDWTLDQFEPKLIDNDLKLYPLKIETGKKVK